MVRVLCFAVIVLTGCGVAPARRDPSRDASYQKTVQQLAALNRQAEEYFKTGKGDDAAAVIQKAQPLQKHVLEVAHPTLEAAESASDLDDLYGRMLLSNHHYGWAQMMFQKNLSRWRHWDPQTEETARRVKLAQAEIEQCTKKIEQ